MLNKFEIPKKIPKGIGFRRVTVLIEGEKFHTVEQVSIVSDAVHFQQLHYTRTTGCGLVITKSMDTAGNYKKVTCIDCLQKHLNKKEAEIQWIRDEIQFQKERLGAKKNGRRAKRTTQNSLT